MSFENYEPNSTLVVPENPVTRAKFPFVDIHSHQWNVTKDKITTRMAVTEEATWAPPLAAPAKPPKMSDREPVEEKLGVKLEFSDFTKGGFWDVEDVLRPIYKETSEKYGREFPYPEKK